MRYKEVKAWLKTQEIEKGVYRSHKAAIIATSDPFGLIADYMAPDGTIYGYLNGKLETIDEAGTEI